MKTTETCLFIGGEMDGKRKALPAGEKRQHVRFPRMIEEPTALPCDPFVKYDYVEYRREKLLAVDTIFEVWVLKDMTMQDAMRSLLANYRPEPAVTP